MTPSSFAPATAAPRRGLAEAIRALPHTAFMLVVLAVASSTVAVANVPVPAPEGSGGVVQIEPDALAVPVVELPRDSASVQAKPRTRARCMACGVIESIRRLEPVGDLPAAFEFTVRLRDGSTRISSSTTQDKWRSGDRIMFIGGPTPSTL